MFILDNALRHVQHLDPRQQAGKPKSDFNPLSLFFLAGRSLQLIICVCETFTPSRLCSLAQSSSCRSGYAAFLCAVGGSGELVVHLLLTGILEETSRDCKYGSRLKAAH